MPLSKDLICKISFFTDKTSGGAIWLSRDLICKKWFTCDYLTREQCGPCRYYEGSLFRYSIIPHRTIYDPYMTDGWPIYGIYDQYIPWLTHI